MLRKAHMRHESPTLWLCAVFAMLLSACTALGIQAPETFNQRLAVGYVTVEGVAKQAQALRASGKLSDADRANVVSTNASAIAALDLAKQMHATNPQAGTEKLTAAITVLNALSAYLATKGQ
jgi:hypothetical protein